MNRDDNAPRLPNLDALIDGLVGNELTDVDRQALLLRLEESPDGWRRCALAFLEDQAWRSALAEFAPGAIAATAVPSPVLPFSRPNLAFRATRWAIAAGLATVALGSSFWAGTAVPGRDDLATAVPLTSHAAPPTIADQAANLNDTTPGQPLGWVGLVQQTDGEAVVRPVPYLASTPANAAWVENQPPTIPEYVRAQLERQGYQVEESHRLVDLNLQDGRRVAIPVDEVAVDYVGRFPL